jgi:hypothetical protein
MDLATASLACAAFALSSSERLMLPGDAVVVSVVKLKLPGDAAGCAGEGAGRGEARPGKNFERSSICASVC